ncbi:tRNA (N6-isopentenyl adenosine(37)-C2)-methylthiotransferase MiaB [Candidatus Persebacteraceae bacterium Df01]|uniref:tRNA-2-methylthio-N(6)-dimethylallyladenosine synthase n=1 Tax=Candidatus Doriopsillibacter californiensis TaxID=2970740 RepID=A0ABT7QNC2_9GAMM|nr:tRNA (N6-isopentenyl adenosine(37)-C2)-methylthiotransferase MiaB [Candidatus Persebacteraceae bacterium Df01]
MSTGKIFVRTFGCQMNAYDSSRMTDALGGKEATVATAEEADIILFNTCSVRDKAQEKVFSDLGRVSALKKKNPNLLIGVGGCVASQEGDNIVRRAPFVDMVFGPQTIHRLPHLIAERRRSGKAQVDVSFPEIEKFDNLPAPEAHGPTAFVSVMEGCSKYCTFCVVPYTRGEEVSRPLDSVLEEVSLLALAGVREVTLLGQNVNAYRAADEDGSIVDFAALLECVAAIDGIERVRFTTSHPVEFSDRLIDAFAHLDKLPNYLHLPVQSGSDRILAAMKRGYTALEYKSIIRKVRQVRPNIAISSDFIVGFPGETAADFEKTIALVEDIGFDFSFSFIFSSRPGTLAANMTDDTPMSEKKARLHRLQEILEASGRRISDAMVGNVETVLVEGSAKKHHGDMQGRTANNRTVNFTSDADCVGQFVPVRITAATPHALRGELATTN